MSPQELYRREMLLGLASLAPGMPAAPRMGNGTPDPRSTLNAREWGAKGDGRQLETRPLQTAIDRCFEAGGGTIFFPAGNYLTGTLFLKSRVAFWLEPGAVLLGSTRLEDYPPVTPAFRSYTDVNYVERSLIYAEKGEQIALLGQGTIDGQGGAPAFQQGHGREGYKKRPYLIRMVECQNVTLRDITLRNSPMWVQHYLACDDLLIDGIVVDSVVNENNDGIDIDCCRRVRISNCRIRSGDDAIVLKSTAPRACEQIVISNCILSSHCSALKCGTESTGGFRDIVVSNCMIHDTQLSGIALESVDGGTLDGVAISNLRMRNVRNPLFLRLGNRARPYLAEGPGGGEGGFKLQSGMNSPGVGRLRNIHISQISGDGGNAIGCPIVGLPGHPIENLCLEGIKLEFEGGGTPEDFRRVVLENSADYPEYAMFGRLPAYGLYCRHVRQLVLSGVNLNHQSPDLRPALFCDDVEAVELTGWHAEIAEGTPEALFRDVQGAWIHGNRLWGRSSSLLHIEGSNSRDICLAANSGRPRNQLTSQSPEVSADAILCE